MATTAKSPAASPLPLKQSEADIEKGVASMGCGASTPVKPGLSLEEAARAVFDSIDTDGSGSVTRVELAAKLKADGELEALLGKKDTAGASGLMMAMRSGASALAIRFCLDPCGFCVNQIWLRSFLSCLLMSSSAWLLMGWHGVSNIANVRIAARYSKSNFKLDLLASTQRIVAACIPPGADAKACAQMLEMSDF